MKYIISAVIAALMLHSCKNKNEEADAFGNFEATEVIISSETNGRIIAFSADEGTRLQKGSLLALVDTTLFHLQVLEVNAGMNSVRTKIASINAQNEILLQQIENLKVNITRIENMLKDDAATRKQYDDLTGQVAVLNRQMAANNIQKASVAAELTVMESRRATLREQISRCEIKSPLSGTLIEKYCEEGELSVAGKPVAKVADLSVMRLKVYVSGAQLERILIGKECTVRIDSGEKGFISMKGTISHISEKAEFTPKIIQTKEERVTLVYAVKIEVRNEGALKSGMPGEAIF